MLNSQRLEHAFVLLDQGNLEQAYHEFVSAADHTDIVLEKAGILLNAVSALRQPADLETARRQLGRVRELLSVSSRDTVLSSSDQDELIRLTVGAEVEEAELCAQEGQLEKAIAKITSVLRDFETKLKERNLIDASDYAQMRRAFLWAEMGRFEKAEPRLEELETRQSQNPILLFYLGRCYMVTGRFPKAQQKLEKAISLNLKAPYDFQAHCSLGMAFYELGNFKDAKLELERGALAANPQYIKEAKIWKWLEYTCISLGLKDEANLYAQRAKPS